MQYLTGTDIRIYNNGFETGNNAEVINKENVTEQVVTGG